MHRIFLLLLLPALLSAQPGDYDFYLAIADDSGFVHCPQKRMGDYQVLAGEVSYPLQYRYELPCEQRMAPNWSSFLLVSKGDCLDYTSTETPLPLQHCIRVQSCLMTGAIAIVHQKRDTMWIHIGCRDRYDWMLEGMLRDPQSLLSLRSIPLTVLFKKGRYSLEEVLRDPARQAREQALYADYMRVELPKALALRDSLERQQRMLQRPLRLELPNGTQPRAGQPLQLLVSGWAMLDGACSSNRPFYTLQILDDGGDWRTLAEQHDHQMDCGLPNKEYTVEPITFDVLPRAGRYRLGLYNLQGGVVWSPEWVVP